MHSRNVMVLQTCASMALILITYGVLLMHSTKHRSRHAGSKRNITNFTTCQTVPVIHMHIFASSEQNLHRLIKSLDAADYGPVRANINIFSNQTLEHTTEPWRHGGYKISEAPLPMEIQKSWHDTLVIIFDDQMEASPLHALWFLIQHCAQTNATAIAGGGESMDSLAGLAMTLDMWNAFATKKITDLSTRSVVSYLSLLPNAIIIVPSIDHAFVRLEWQDPLAPERAPKLMRAWDPENRNKWGVKEMRL